VPQIGQSQQEDRGIDMKVYVCSTEGKKFGGMSPKIVHAIGIKHAAQSHLRDISRYLDLEEYTDILVKNRETGKLYLAKFRGDDLITIGPTDDCV
jgi:hypothetical protein